MLVGPLWAAAQSQIYETPEGNVGIGVPNPTQKFMVNGEIYSIGGLTSAIDSPEGGKLSLVNYMKSNAGTARTWTIYNMTGVYGNSLQFWMYETPPGSNASGPKFVIQDNGFVGIGNPFPQSELAVAGTITTKKVKVTNTGWADFVFDPNYTLPSLGALEAFIKEQKHLPEIPSEQTISKEGLDLSEMAKLQMQKIEELTLYIIRQQKEIDELKTAMKNMQQKLDKQ